MRYAVALVAFLLVSAAFGGTATGQESPELGGPEETRFDVFLEENGEARWVVSMAFTVDTEAERSAFRDYAASYEAGDAPAGPSVEFFRAAAASASDVADREMRIVEVSRDSLLEGETGTLQLSFRWTAFLGENENGYTLQDALRTPDGSWLHSLESGQELRIHTPPNHDIVRSIAARQENNSLVITGPESFDDDEFVVVYERTAPTTSSETPGPDTDWGAVATGLLALLFAVVIAVVLWRWRSTESVLPTTGESNDDGESPAAAPPSAEPDAEEVQNDPENQELPEDEPSVAPELLSDEERVEQLLEQNGGRMRQADIVTETDWSDAKVSQLLSRMAEEGRIEKLRLGRENVISLPDEEV